MRIQNLLTALLILFTVMFSTQAKAIAMTSPATISRGNDSLRIIQLQKRVADIQQMDVQSMSAAQKHSLKVELKGMLSQARAMDGGGSGDGVYLSVGGLIIIILLLILILR
jgi:hypothetical protein